MSTIQIDLTKKVKNMKPMHAGGQPPVTSTASDVYFHYLTEAGIPYSRLHDVGGAFGAGKYVDIPNIFRDFDADETDPSNYDFTFTDLLINQLVKAKVEPYYRLGVTIENAAAVKSYWIDPPKDYAKWARICEHIIRHYTEGWADGFYHKITYWEIWPEPDGSFQMLWTGTREQFFDFYHTVATHLKFKFPHLKFGTFGSHGFYAVVGGGYPWSNDVSVTQGFVDYFHAFMQYVKANNTPLDFFSWHCYAPASYALKMDEWLHEQLVSYGYGDLETHLNEWDPYADELGTGHHAAELAAMMIGMQKGHTDMCCIYDMRTSDAPFCPLFNPITHKPIHGYYSLVAFNHLYKLGTEVETLCDTEALYAVAASDGTHHALVISNLTGKTQPLDIQGVDLENARWHVIDQTRMLSWSPAVNRIKNNSVLLIEF